MDFLKCYNLQIIWVDSCVVMLCLAANDAVCQSSKNVEAKRVACSGYAGMSQCSNDILCRI